MSDDSSNQPVGKEVASGRVSKLAKAIEVTATGLLLYLVPPNIAYVVLLLGAGVGAGYTSQRAADWLGTSTFGQFLYVAITEALVIFLLIRLMRWTHETWRSIAVKKPALRHAVYMVGGFIAYYVIYIAIVSVVSQIIHLDTNQRQEIGFDTHVTGIGLILAFASLVVLPPLVEEILFRGYLYTKLRRAFSYVSAAILISILFAIPHLQPGLGNKLLWIAALDTFTLSMVLVHVREKTGTIWAGVGIHALKNFVAFLSLFVLHL